MPPQFNLAFRPATYWPELPGTRARLSRIKGTVRRRVAQEAITADGLGAIPEMFEESLSDENRKAWGKMHPSQMGGEWLPDLLPGEVEIARLEYASVTADVVAIRARPADGEIRYRIVDEYEETYVSAVESSREPLTLGEMLGLLDRSYHPAAPTDLIVEVAYGMVEGPWEDLFRGGDSPEEAVNFVSVSSVFYPLAEYYENRVAEWIEVARRNPLSAEITTGLRAKWQDATEERRTVATAFLQAHGYRSGMFERYGARDLSTVLSLLRG
jgi:hypothetical protein